MKQQHYWANWYETKRDYNSKKIVELYCIKELQSRQKGNWSKWQSTQLYLVWSVDFLIQQRPIASFEQEENEDEYLNNEVEQWYYKKA